MLRDLHQWKQRLDNLLSKGQFEEGQCVQSCMQNECHLPEQDPKGIQRSAESWQGRTKLGAALCKCKSTCSNNAATAHWTAKERTVRIGVCQLGEDLQTICSQAAKTGLGSTGKVLLLAK